MYIQYQKHIHMTTPNKCAVVKERKKKLNVINIKTGKINENELIQGTVRGG